MKPEEPSVLELLTRSVECRTLAPLGLRPDLPYPQRPCCQCGRVEPDGRGIVDRAGEVFCRECWEKQRALRDDESQSPDDMQAFPGSCTMAGCEGGVLHLNRGLTLPCPRCRKREASK